MDLRPQLWGRPVLQISGSLCLDLRFKDFLKLRTRQPYLSFTTYSCSELFLIDAKLYNELSSLVDGTISLMTARRQWYLGLCSEEEITNEQT